MPNAGYNDRSIHGATGDYRLNIFLRLIEESGDLFELIEGKHPKISVNTGQSVVPCGASIHGASIHGDSDVSTILSRKATVDLHVFDMLKQSISAYNSGLICEEKRDKIIERVLRKRQEREAIVSAFQEPDVSYKVCCSVM